MLAAMTALLEALSLGLAAMAFDPAAFGRVSEPGASQMPALIVAFFAGVSQTLGHAAVLLLNQVKPWRFALSLGLIGLIYVSGALVTALGIAVAGGFASGARVEIAPLLGVIALGYAPRLLGFLTLAPYFGEALDRFLGVWVLVLTVFGLQVAFSIPFWQAAAAAGMGWLSMRLLRLLFGRPLGALIQAARRLAAGQPLTLTQDNLVEALRARARAVRDWWESDR